MNKLPEKLSDLLAVAINDCEVLVNDKNYNFKFDDIYVGYDKKCHICDAGAVLVNSLKLNECYDLPEIPILYKDLKEILNLQDWDISRLLAVDWLRSGSILQALNEIRKDINDENYKKIVYDAVYDEDLNKTILPYELRINLYRFHSYKTTDEKIKHIGLMKELHTVLVENNL